ncbi:putative PhoD-like phosphatase-2 [Elsinoe australis]|uniref:Putative PhoD-like phosphatase-2 n=1 Tax=Elsinoe australis TaxID=40998 RepID=A0A4U7B2K1_9PEZI|nr:putative PhoD-like phosphatase-2 [Elsinoe australis]
MLFTFVAAASLAVGVAADYHGNLNYRSPSFNHPSMGLDLPKITKRHALEKRQANSTWDPAALNFTHGVASGDPYPDSVVLWTRISPQLENDRSNVTVEGTVPLFSHETERYIRASTRPICVDWRVSTNRNFTGPVVSSGRAYTTSDIDYTVKVEAEGLSPYTVYYYQFNVCGSSKRSPVGRTKTSPDEDDDTTNLALAVFSCSNYPSGYFNAYGNAARRDEVDYFVHLGDYIYETSSGVLGRDARATNPPKTIFSLFDYRTRIAQYRTDQDLLLSHQNFAWVTTWDDHEVANNVYRDGSSAVNNTEDSFLRSGRVSVDQRKMNAVRAYFEWMPIRQVNLDNNLRIWRNFRMGKLFDLIVLDTRNYDRSITDLNWNEDYLPKISNDAGRSMMGSEQENWFYRTLRESKQRGASWRVIGNQVVFSRVNVTSWFGTFENPFNNDQWDGYVSNRNRTFETLYSNDIGNNIMLAGDSHANWVSDLVQLDAQSAPDAALNGQDGIPAYNQATGEGSIGVEFAVTAVSSSGFGGSVASANQQASELVRDNAELMWNEGYFRGYLKLSLSTEEARAEYYGPPTVRLRTAWDLPLGNFTTASGSNHLTRPIGGGQVNAGALKDGVNPGQVNSINGTLALNTETGEWAIPPADLIAGGNFISYARANTTA